MSSTLAEIIARPHRDVGFVLFVEGLPYAWTNRTELAGSGVGSWISGAPGGEREVIMGLEVPETISYSSSLEDGMLSSEDGASFKLHDFEGKLIALVAEQEGDTIGETIGPKTDPCPAATTADAIPLWGRWINGEAIGGAGERRYYPAMPVTLPGPDHAAFKGDSQTLALSVVRDAPTWLEGLRCALYVIYHDEIEDRWPNWQTHHSSGHSLVWYGTTRELTCEALTWTLACDGPTSLLRKQLGCNRSREWLPVSTLVSLSSEPAERTDLSAYNFTYRSVSSFEQGASSFYDTTDDLLPATGTAADYRAAIQARLNTVAATAGPDVTWSTDKNATCKFNAGQVQMQVEDVGWCAYAMICLHESVWHCLGYDPRVQTGDSPNGDPYIISFHRAELLTNKLSAFSDVPGPGYWVARFNTLPAQYATLEEAGTDADNDGKVRTYAAIMDENVSTLLQTGQQELNVGLAGSLPYLEGQTCRPPAEHTFSNGGGDADTTAFVCLKGSYRTRIDQDPVTMVLVAKVSWKDDTSSGGHGPTPDADSNLPMYLERFIDQKFFGMPLGFAGQWSAFDLSFAPVNYMGYQLDLGDRADLVLTRTMLSTGTATWSGYEGQGATITVGDNAHSDIDAMQGDDVEIADLGLAIPESLVDVASFVRTANQLPDGGKNSPINRVKFAWVGSFDSQELFARVLEQRGWGMGLVKGQFRLFNRAEIFDLEDVEVTLSSDDIVGDQDYVETAELRPALPRDVFEMEYGAPLVEEAGGDVELVVKVGSADPGARTRRTNNVSSIDGAGMIPVKLWKDADNAPPSWLTSWSGLVGNELAAYFASPWVLVTVPIVWSKAKDIGVGSVVKFTSLYAPTRDGVYGMTGRLARVVGWSLRTEELVVDLQVLVQAGDPSTKPARFAPIAQVLESVTSVESRHDAAVRTFYCYADAFGHGESQADVAWFAEPAYLGTGTDALVYGYQHDGRRWDKTFEFIVESVSTDHNSITYKAGSLTGTFWEARPTTLMLAPYDDQDANSWTRLAFSATTGADGFHGAGPTKGKKLV